ncbi:MAG: sigma-54-dependent Fis family transcriptional regulator [Calditrichaeota bacterium]|nr:sigma-54-dependent Fis family transcriptional regulator [Calditrichota bacterium]
MKILIAEDDPATRRGIEIFLQNQGFDVVSTENGAAALRELENQLPDVVLSDVKMPRMGGLDFLREIRLREPNLPVLMMTAFASVEDAVQAMKQGADDYLTKPLNLEELRLKLNRIQEKAVLLEENRALRAQLKRLEFPEIVGTSKPIREVFQLIAKAAADPDIPVMIYGESGTGKELVARAIHTRSRRAQAPFVAVNCGAIPENLIESELFGHKRGAFTGAVRDKEGLFQAAQNGTLFLDEVSEMSPQLQVKLLRVLQESRVKPVGGTVEIPVNVRILGASNKDLRKEMADGRFREDLFYRLNVLEVTLPPLRERRDDIPLLVHHFAEKYRKDGGEPKHFSRKALERLSFYDWPGNVRELENTVRVTLVSAPGKLVNSADLPPKITRLKPVSDSGTGLWKWDGSDYKYNLQKVVEAFEREFLTFHLHETGGNVSQTAEKIGLSRVALHKKIKLYGIK